MKKLVVIYLIMLFLRGGIAQAQYTVLHNFNDTDGANPLGSLTYSGSKLYGMTSVGGAYKDGCLFSIDINGNNYKNLFDFDGINGYYPQGSLIISGSMLYGITNSGGTLYKGNIFSIDTNGKGYKVLHNFNDTAGWVAYGYSSLVLSGNVLFGMTEYGGANNDGCVFSIDVDGSNYKDIFDFNGINGEDPTGSLIFSGSKLCGMTTRGGINGCGLIFSINMNGQGYKDLWDFDDTGYANANGIDPQGSLTLSGNKFYGMTSSGGQYGQGNIFSIDTDGTEYTNLLTLNYEAYGEWPTGNLVLLGNRFYGMTDYGTYRTGRFTQKNDSGYIFSINTDGSGFTDLYNFNLAEGYAPYGSLTAVGNTLYGMTSQGGAYHDGIIFSISDKGTGIDKLAIPTGSITVYPNPSDGMLTFQIMNSKLRIRNNVEVYNIVGEKVFAKTLCSAQGDNTIDISNQPNGVYLYRVITETGELVGEGKLVIER